MARSMDATVPLDALRIRIVAIASTLEPALGRAVDDLPLDRYAAPPESCSVKVFAGARDQLNLRHPLLMRGSGPFLRGIARTAGTPPVAPAD